MIGGALAPGLLIAAPPLGDPNFERTVVLLALHGPRGALGFVINRTSPMMLGNVLSLAGYENAGTAEGRVFVGGPVEPGSGWIITRSPDRLEGVPGVIEVGDQLWVSSSRTAFDRVAGDLDGDASRAKCASEVCVVLGYSGWGPGQLEGEIASGAWLPIQLDLVGSSSMGGVVFDVEPEERWSSAHALLGLSPLSGFGMRTVGDA